MADRAKMARLPTNRYGNPFLNQYALLRTDHGNTVRRNASNCHQPAGTGPVVRGKGRAADGQTRDPPEHLAAALPRTRAGQHPQITGLSYMLPASMRHESSYGGGAVFICAKFVNALLEDREPAVNV